MVAGFDRFDASRAALSNVDLFEPFRVTTTRLLRDALASEDVSASAQVLMTHRGPWTLTLLVREMSLYHVAQGEIAGDPWMVTF